MDRNGPELGAFDQGFDAGALPSIRLRGDFGPGHAFHVNRPFVERHDPGRLHDHDFFEVFWIETGAATHLVNDRELRLPAGSLCFVRPADRHAFRNDGAEPCRMVNVAFAASSADHLRARYGDELAGRFFWAPDALPVTVRLDRARSRELRRLERALDGGARTLTRVEGFLLQVMGGLMGGEGAAPVEMPLWLATACEAMRDEARLCEGVPALVRLTGKSHEHLSRTVRRCLGLSPSAWVNRRRMEAAARRLAETEMPIVEVALGSGIEDLSHFYRLFKAEYGITPGRFRRRDRANFVHPAT